MSETPSFSDYCPTITDKEPCLHGFHLDVIETLYQPPDYADSSRKSVEKSWMLQEKNALYMATGETMEEAFLRTIVAGFRLFPSGGTGHAAHGFAMAWPENVSSTD
jgi:hypothetical protein